ncbi:MAG: FAD-dependent oxidoreductase, partial [Smithella sp.]|nr:FAD-dependent oxidoreductase [Smithella sp.]
MSGYIFKDVVIIGGGPAGMAVADRLYDLGIKDIILFEKESYLGGVLPQCIHDGFGLIKFAENLSGPEYSAIYTNRLKEKNIDVRLCSTVMEISCEKGPATAGDFPVAFHTSVSCISKNDLSDGSDAPDGTIELITRAIVLASGCREKNRSNMYIPGTRPDGIFTAGTAQSFVNLHDLMPGKEAVILGSGDIGLIMARRLTLEGCKVKCVAEIDSVSGGLKRNIKQCLDDYGIPLLLNTTVTNIFGFPRVEAVEICNVKHDEVNKTFTILKDTARIISCDTLILSAGLLPENSLIQDLDYAFSGEVSGKVLGEPSCGSSSELSSELSCGPSSELSSELSCG